jgi:hypothetical protein
VKWWNSVSYQFFSYPVAKKVALCSGSRFDCAPPRGNVRQTLRVSWSQLEVYGGTAPVFGAHVGDGLGEVPDVAEEVLGVVLALAIDVVLWFREDDGPVAASALAMADGVFDANLNDVGAFRFDVAFGDRNAAVSRSHLDTMVGDAETDGESECSGEPFGCSTGVGIEEVWDDGARRDGTVEKHRHPRE